MGRTKNPEQSVRFGGIVSREADRLTILINRILDFSRGNSGNIHYECRVIDLSALLRSVTDEYRPHLDLSHTPLTTTIQDGVTLKADPEALRSAIVNLLDNANKYTPESAADRRIEIEMTVETAQATIEVRDRGIGIPITEQTRIFDAFFRASTAGEIRGAGLGLSMVRRFAEGHDGSIQALPRHGGGSIFRLILPIYLTPQNPSSRPDDIATSQQDPAQEIATLQKDSDHE
jgi:two-component system phosphate regulon sensor histidine kinase PhoR